MDTELFLEIFHKNLMVRNFQVNLLIHFKNDLVLLGIEIFPPF